MTDHSVDKELAECSHSKCCSQQHLTLVSIFVINMDSETELTLSRFADTKLWGVVNMLEGR